MPFFDDLIKTYDNVQGREPNGMLKIAPIAHTYSKKSYIDVFIDENGTLREPPSAHKIGKDEHVVTIIPVTEQSLSRTNGIAPHALCDTLKYLTPNHFLEEKDGEMRNPFHEAYIKQLESWVDSPHTCPEIEGVLKFLKSDDLVKRLVDAKQIPVEDGVPKIGDKEDYLVRWLVKTSDDAVEETWESERVRNAWTAYYTSLKSRTTKKQYDALTGDYYEPSVERSQPSPVAVFGKAKLLSSAVSENQLRNYTGNRFSGPSDLASIGYIPSQKAHAALTWLCETQGLIIGKIGKGETPYMVLCWNPDHPEDKTCMKTNIDIFGSYNADIAAEDSPYKTRLAQLKDLVERADKETFRQTKVSIAILRQSGTGRFAVVYYRSKDASEFIQKVETWYSHYSWYKWNEVDKTFKMSPIPIFTIAKCVAGRESISDGKARLIVQDKEYASIVSRLYVALLDGSPIPKEYIRRVVENAQNPMLYKGVDGKRFINHKMVMRTACALVCGEHLRNSKGENDRMLDKNNNNPGYVYGRMLAVLNKVEEHALYNKKKKTEGTEEKKEQTSTRITHAMRMWNNCSSRPWQTFCDLRIMVAPYYESLSGASRSFYENESAKIMELMDGTSRKARIDKGAFLLGYYHETAFLNRRKSAEEESENGNDSSDAECTEKVG